MALIFRAYYYGVAESHLKMLEEVSQATVSEYFRLFNRILELQTDASRDYNDIDYSITISRFKDPEEYDEEVIRIILNDNSAGYFAVLDRLNPFKHNRDITDFFVHCQEGKSPKKINWEKLHTAHCYGKAGIHFKARRGTGDDDKEEWSCPFHRIDFQHPLLHNLKMAVYELEGRTD